MSSEGDINNDTSNEGAGLGGWLFLLGISIVVDPIRMILEGISDYRHFFKNGGWQHTDSTIQYFVISEIVIYCILTIMSVLLVYLFFCKKRLFPKIFIISVVATFVFNIADLFISSLLFPHLMILEAEEVKALLGLLVYGLIWIPYIHYSEQVKITFVR